MRESDSTALGAGCRANRVSPGQSPRESSVTIRAQPIWAPRSSITWRFVGAWHPDRPPGLISSRTIHEGLAQVRLISSRTIHEGLAQVGLIRHGRFTRDWSEGLLLSGHQRATASIRSAACWVPSRDRITAAFAAMRV